jgi:hypothetical protein
MPFDRNVTRIGVIAGLIGPEEKAAIRYPSSLVKLPYRPVFFLLNGTDVGPFSFDGRRRWRWALQLRLRLQLASN